MKWFLYVICFLPSVFLPKSASASDTIRVAETRLSGTPLQHPDVFGMPLQSGWQYLAGDQLEEVALSAVYYKKPGTRIIGVGFIAFIIACTYQILMEMQLLGHAHFSHMSTVSLPFVQDHRGHIQVASQVGQGATFTVVLPMDLDERGEGAS